MDPPTGTKVEAGESVTLSGYAYSGGGNGIIRVDISFDGGKTWNQAQLYNENDPFSQKSFAWTLWSYEVIFRLLRKIYNVSDLNINKYGVCFKVNINLIQTFSNH